ncbi:MAG: NAD-dependent epimerase [Cytophagales bacterium CG12_big_fil_rev_8_21_14_0_65_40_12]|nr:MAG: NAD-dependent epimerase [Cytophagales bacterium CG12_big_fil_rev_8_21_14_0_65_40_12]PIW04278.1 MAG: NAD-dependent epimerase [Cytophagales bacterium CG17_big_fil_post_rev_8_21_14_2_50_40_13]
MNKLLVTGSGGLIGSEVVSFFSERGWQVHGVDNNMRQDFFGAGGDTTWNIERLKNTFSNYEHSSIDIRNRPDVLDLIYKIQPDAIVHTAAQPSHDLAASRPFDDFDVNAVGTLNLLEALRQFSTNVPFVHMSTNKVYGDAPNNLNLIEKDSRWDYVDVEYANGIPESFTIDQSKHSVFGASKVAADVMVQEYGRYFGMPTCCLRGGCLTGPNHSGVELHGFLSYLIKCNLQEKEYTIFGYKGKQVRDNIHSYDVVRFIEEFLKSPRSGEVYNLGGGRENSVSILEAFDLIAEISGKPMKYKYSDQNRLGDHICYISDLSKMKSHYPDWDITKDLKTTFQEIHDSWVDRLK